MKIVIQCAGSKTPSAGSFRMMDGRQVFFVADPTVLVQNDFFYAKPDDLAEESEESWRQKLVEYNKSFADKNPLHLLPAYKLYTNPAYSRLVGKFGKKNVFILSAGWGIIPADFLTPPYDITFSASGDQLNRRRKYHTYQDFSMIENDGDEVVFLGGKSYLPLFYDLTKDLKGQRTIFYNSLTPPGRLLRNVRMVRFETTTRTNWHYKCAQALSDGQIDIGK